MMEQKYDIKQILNIESLLPLYRLINHTLIETDEKPPEDIKTSTFLFKGFYPENCSPSSQTAEHNIKSSYREDILRNVSDSELLGEISFGENVKKDILNNNIIDLINNCIGTSPQLEETNSKEVSTGKRKYRKLAFSIAVKRLYNYKCAICGSDLRGPGGHPEVQSAHIYPKKLNGSDDVRNGICLCRLHHWAFDIGWITISDDYKILAHKDLPNTQFYDFIRNYIDKTIILPDDLTFAPHSLFLNASRKYMGFI